MRNAFRTAIFLALLAACSGETADPTTAVRDSAGITIVENRDPAWSNDDAWRLDSAPSLTIGTIDGQPEYQLYRVRGALRLDDGTIVVADGGSRQIRFYDANGEHVRSVGGQGEGPGEYRVPGLLARYPADSLIIWDGSLRRGTILGLDGNLGRTFNGPLVGTPFYYARYVFADGSLFGQLDRGVDLDTVELGVLRNDAVNFRMDPTGRVDTVGVFFSNQLFAYVGDRGTTLTGIPFEPRAVYATEGEYLHYGSSLTYEIRTFTMGGDLVRIIRTRDENVPVTQNLIDAYKDASLARITDPATLRSMEARWAVTPWPETLPAYADLMADAESNLWVADYLAPGDEQPRWRVFDPEGRMLGTIETPIGFTIHEIGSDYLLGVERDELDVEKVVIYRLIKP